jgi:2'-5' RNA ligase
MSYYFSYDAKELNKILKENLSKEDKELLYNKNKLHLTLLYDKEEISNFENLNAIIFSDIKVKINNVVSWKGYDRYYLVARIENKDLTNIHNELIKITGAKHSHEKFNPHITLQSSINENELIDKEKLNFLINHEVTLSNFHLIDKGSSLKPKLK